ncbi:long-chain fatty acid--CoA ligase [Streptomyces sp. V3I7]|uniref:AMP-dependent synthetase/ligase n=1 Tax=Streptomyces sp. V3I7 TaxID=3042278 RepID=UPI00278095DC|nr:AMP-dependent synthetase/ligase [Streptomyces sp. V3I7]MDQ0992370.1 long-chain acyl-CoA synthetase [Streptomyces sp. V3I7]
MSTPFSNAPAPSGAPVQATDYDGEAILVKPETRRLNGVVREASVPPFAPPVTHGSLADLPFENAEANPHAVVLSRRTAGGRWQDVTAAQFAHEVMAVATALIAEGLEPGDRIAIMARTTYEWTLLDFGAWAAGLVTVPVYPTSSAFQTQWILADSGAVALVTETADQAAALDSQLERLPALRHVWVMEKGHVDSLVELGSQVPGGASEVAVRRGMLGPGTLATVIYTSGTTGRPKGCALSHGNFFAEVDNAKELLRPVFRTKSGEPASVLLFLPLSHVFGRMVSIMCLRSGVRLGHAPSLKPADLLPDLAAFRPTCLLTIPYMLEKVFNTARARAEADGRLTSFDRAAAVAERFGEALVARQTGTGSGPKAALKTSRAFYDPLVYRHIRNALGGRVQYVICGGSPLGRRLGAFYAGAGIEILEGYGLTETAGATTVMPPLKPRLGTVGWPLPGTKIHIAADGEILIGGEHVLRGYWDPRAGGVVPATRDGWLATGDIGRLDDEGYLTITGRKKELMITAGGKSVAPAPLENWLRSHPLISQCMLVGDGRPYVVALVTLDRDGITHWRQMHGKHPVPPELLTTDAELRAVLQQAVDEANALVSRPESIRDFAVLPVDFTEEAGQLTPSMKVRREQIMRDFAAQVEQLYAGYTG